MFKKILLLFYTVFIFITAFTQVGLHSNVQQFTTDNGLPSNGIKGIQWDDKTGFLWLATEAGIVRFNGVDFRSFTKDNTDGLCQKGCCLWVAITRRKFISPIYQVMCF